MTTVQRTQRPQPNPSATPSTNSQPTGVAASQPAAIGVVPATAAPLNDAYEATDSAHTQLPCAQSPSQGNPLNPVATFAMHQSQGRSRLCADLEALDVKLDVAARAVPQLAEAAVHNALSVSSQRVLQAFDAGRIDLEEAERAQHMLSEMISAMAAIESGHYNIIEVDDPGAHGMAVYDVQTTDNDTIRVAVRGAGSTAGEARLKLVNTMDNGEPVSAERRMMVRFDLEGSGLEAMDLQAAIDVQLGHDKPVDDAMTLDKRIHGVVLLANGQPKLNRGGRTIADHHFSQGLPDALNQADAFGRFVSNFLDNLLNHPGEDT